MKFKTIKQDVHKLDIDKILTKFCFGQKCEDFLVNLIFKRKTTGSYIDVGAHDGIRFSNSYAFSRLGWKGICVEAHPDYYNICSERRHDDLTKVINVACSNSDSEKVTFYSNYRGSLSTLNPNLNDDFKRDYKGYYVDQTYSEKVQNFTNGPIEIPSRTMDSLLEQYKDFIDVTNIDLVTIDVDGSEEFVLPGFNILKYKPRVIILEVSTVAQVVYDYMNKTNYHKLYDNGTNVIYCRDTDDQKLFDDELEKLKDKTLFTIDTGHPLD